MATYVKNALQLGTVASGFEPRPQDAAKLLTDALAHMLVAHRLPVEDAVAHLRDSAETISGARAQASRPTYCARTRDAKPFNKDGA